MAADRVGFPADDPQPPVGSNPAVPAADPDKTAAPSANPQSSPSWADLYPWGPEDTGQRYRRLVQDARDAIFLLTADGLIASLNPAFERITGRPRPAWLGQPFAPLIHPDDLPGFLNFFQRAVRGETLPAFEARLPRGGESAILEFLLTPEFSEGRVLSVLVVARDVTRQRQAEEQLRRAEEQLRRAQKLEALGRLAGGVAHDFNNFLTVILGFAELLQGQFAQGTPGRMQAAQISRAGERAARLTRQLLAFGRKQPLDSAILDVNALVRDLAELLVHLLEKDVKLVTHLEAATWPVRADASQIEQIVMNLVVNARDAIPQKGTITLRTANVEPTEPIVGVPDLPPGRFVRIEVSDTGVGMDEATRARLFEPFFTTKGPGSGTGLGLATVYGVVRQCGGTVAVRSSPGRGTTFQVYLPALSAPPATLTEPAPVPPPADRGDATVLVAEDEGEVRSLVTGVLRAAGYQVLEASDGEEAVAVAEAYKEEIDLLLTDLRMPRLSGDELGSRLTTRRPGIRVLYMSGNAGEFKGNRPVLSKPFTVANLLREVRGALDEEGLSEGPAQPLPKG